MNSFDAFIGPEIHRLLSVGNFLDTAGNEFFQCRDNFAKQRD